MAPSVSKIDSTTRGASPSDGSSSISSRGDVISARPIATICCWPPDSVLDHLTPSLLEHGEEMVDALEARLLVRPGARAEGAEREVLLHRHLAEESATLGHERQAVLDDLVRVERQHVLALRRDRARAWSEQARDALEERALAGAVRPERARRSLPRRPRASLPTAPGGRRRPLAGRGPQAMPLGPQIHVDDRRVGGDVGGGAVRDLLARAQDEDPLRKVEESPDDVLDHDQGEPFALERLDQCHGGFGLRRRQSREELVEEQEARARRQRPRELHALSVHDGELAGPQVSLSRRDPRARAGGRRRREAPSAAGGVVRSSGPPGRSPRTESPMNGRTSWKVRAMPSPHTACAERPAMS